MAAPVHDAGSSAAVALLTRISPASAAPSISVRTDTEGPVMISSRCDPHQEHLIGPGVHPDRHPKGHPSTRGIEPADLAQPLTHAGSRLHARSACSAGSSP